MKSFAIVLGDFVVARFPTLLEAAEAMNYLEGYVAYDWHVLVIVGFN